MYWSTHARLRLLQYNWLMRTYLTPAKLHQFNNNFPDICIKFEQSKGTLFHCMWDCKVIRIFWHEISQIIHKMLNVRLPLDPKMFILGLYPPTLVISRNKWILMNMSLLQTKHSIALLCKSTQMPQVGQWLREMSNSYAMEKITYWKEKGKPLKTFGAPLLNYMGMLVCQLCCKWMTTGVHERIG